MIEQYKQLLDQISKLEKVAVKMLLFDLLKSGKLDFVDFATAYVNYLEEDNSQKRTKISTLGLHLATYCVSDKSVEGANARRHLYDTGMYGHNDGSKFGQQLDDEFGSGFVIKNL